MSAEGGPRRLRILRPFEWFFRQEASGGLVLLAAAVAAVVWANSPAHESYFAFREATAVVGIGPFVLSESLLHWIDDGLMAVFFLLVGLEIKREFISGELSNRRAAALPAVGALGGMVIPAILYVAVTWGTPAVSGWGAAMATDIAFALGALALLARRIPASLRVFLAAVAIVDDLGAVLVIALFYTPEIVLPALLVAAVVFLLLVALNLKRVYHLGPYMVLGVILWLAVLESGVHATLAGVLLALTIPVRAPPSRAPERAAIARALDETMQDRPGPEREELQQALLRTLEETVEAEEAPLNRLEHGLLPWVTFGIIPLFAFANAGVRIEGSLVDALATPAALGIVIGLVVGKQIGMTLFPYLAVRFGFATLPAGATWRHMYGIAWLAGIGFTMALFISGLGLPVELLDEAKIGIITASLIAATGGFLVLMGAGTGDAAPS